MRKIRIAQIGLSKYGHGMFVFENLKKQRDVFDIAGYALPENEDKKFREQAKTFAGYPEMTVEQILNDPKIEAVAIETEEVFLTKYARMAAKHGKHIHMEKPGGIVSADFEKLIALVKENKKIFHLGYMYRYNPKIKQLFGQIKNGALGDVISVEAQMSCRHDEEAREFLKNFPGGIMFFLGCHLVDLVLQIMGKPLNIIAFQKSTGIANVSACDFGMATLEYQKGVSVIKTNAAEIGGFARRQLVVTGTKATVELRPLERYTGNFLYTESCLYKKEDWNDTGEQEKSVVFDRFDCMLRSFAAYILGEKSNPYTPDYELELYQTVLQCCGINERK